jgi:hypothetical protein
MIVLAFKYLQQRIIFGFADELSALRQNCGFILSSAARERCTQKNAASDRVIDVKVLRAFQFRSA